MLEVGTVLGRDFRVVSHLASGAMGAVYIVEQLSTGKKRAMKVMSPELADNDRARERFVLEARVGAHIDSDHVVEVVTAGIDETTRMPFLVMELLKGHDLGNVVETHGALPLRDVAIILKQAGHALAKAHAQGVVHRDLKPENLFLAESRREGVPFTVKILDFGIAKLVAERGAAGTQAIGTPLFMAPEQTDRKGTITPACDVWALGLIAFYLLTGQFYWLTGASGITTLLREVVIENLDPASSRAEAYGVRQLVPPGFDEWFARCVNRNPGERFRDAGEAVRAFEQMVLGGPASGALSESYGHSGVTGSMPVVGSAVVRTDPNAVTTDKTQPADLPPLAPNGHSVGTVGTSLTAAASMPSSQPRSIVGLVVGGVFALGALAAGAWFFLRPPADASETSADAPVTTAAPTASAAAATPCPEGMLLVEGGKMFMGSTDGDLADDVRPPHKVSVSSYCLDKHEVTAEAYDACVKGGNCLRAPNEVKYPGATPVELVEHSKLCNGGVAARKRHPINCVDWNMADAFCREKGARLPTEAEWEFASRGSSQRVYPWGDDAPGPKLLNACGSECTEWAKSLDLPVYGSMFDGNDGHAATAPVGSFPKGASSAGVLDLAGNVWEWTADWYAPYTADEQKDPKGASSGTERVVRGGGFNGLKPAWAKPAYRWKATPDWRSDGVGFRCAADPRK
ncbi:MAG TPA: bifunctional serine/threonine-protein kinase/formylglycine-generating enzyme family protein [Polyangiaceae bacterium]|nr:bifunctional serine/threonine-protein kinase/formylglycine-generating enzyme family protein [Polyangiaceae bacterium]